MEKLSVKAFTQPFSLNLVQAATKPKLHISFYEFIQVDVISAQGSMLYQSLVHSREDIFYGFDHCEEKF